MTHKFFIYSILAWFIILIGFSFTIFPYHDSFYYWTWSQKLQLSYYDGPPLIAYVLKLFTLIFGSSIFAINFVGVVFAYLASYYLYKLCYVISGNSNTARLATVFYLVYPFVTTRFIYMNMTYDCLENLFYLMIIYYVVTFIKTRNSNYWLVVGYLSGFCLLSKYSAVVLFLGLLVFFVSYGRCYKIFKTWQLYVGMILSVLLFTPVIYWNYLNHWESFLYQLNSHKWIGDPGSINSRLKYGLPGVWFFIANCVLATFHILIVVLLFGKFKLKFNYITNNYEKLLVIVILVFYAFWLYNSYSSHVSLNYVLPVSFIPIYFVSKLLIKYNLVKFQLFLLCSCCLISVLMMAGHSRLANANFDDYAKFVETNLISQPLHIWNITK